MRHPRLRLVPSFADRVTRLTNRIARERKVLDAMARIVHEQSSISAGSWETLPKPVQAKYRNLIRKALKSAWRTIDEMDAPDKRNR